MQAGSLYARGRVMMFLLASLLPSRVQASCLHSCAKNMLRSHSDALSAGKPLTWKVCPCCFAGRGVWTAPFLSLHFWAAASQWLCKQRPQLCIPSLQPHPWPCRCFSAGVSLTESPPFQPSVPPPVLLLPGQQVCLHQKSQERCK